MARCKKEREFLLRSIKFLAVMMKLHRSTAPVPHLFPYTQWRLHTHKNAEGALKQLPTDFPTAAAAAGKRRLSLSDRRIDARIAVGKLNFFSTHLHIMMPLGGWPGMCL